MITCHFSTREPDSTDSVAVTLQLNGTGTFTSSIRAGAINDVNGANDGASLVITSNAPTPPSGGGGGSGGGGNGGGGGGSLEWLTLAVLALLVAGRLRPGLRRCGIQ